VKLKEHSAKLRRGIGSAVNITAPPWALLSTSVLCYFQADNSCISPYIGIPFYMGSSQGRTGQNLGDTLALVHMYLHQHHGMFILQGTALEGRMIQNVISHAKFRPPNYKDH
jgi:hypothetical protein